MKIVLIDTEVFSETDLTVAGAKKYFADPSTQTLLVTFKPLGKPTEIWDYYNDDSLDRLHELADDKDNVFVAFNAPFDYEALLNIGIYIPLFRWRCLQVATLALGFNGSLDMVLERFEIPHQKQRDGKILIRRFCMPQPPSRKVKYWNKANDPDNWNKFRAYAIQDTEVLEPLYRKCAKYGNMVDWREWRIDRTINERGIPVDLDLIEAAIKANDEEKTHLLRNMIDITGLENPGSKIQLGKWLKSQGLKLHNMRKETLLFAVKNNHKISSKVKDVINMSLLYGKTSNAKYDKLAAVYHDGRVHNLHQYLGAARTGRDAHRLVQPGNLPRGNLKDPRPVADLLLKAGREGLDLVYGDVMNTLSSLIRCTITAPDGDELVIADLSGIEGRVLPWQCRFQKKIDQIASGLDMYKVTYSETQNIPYSKVTKEGRFAGKVQELAFGYQGSVGAYNTWLETFGRPKLDDSEALPIVRAWREKNAPIVRYWYDCEKAFRMAIRNPGKIYKVHYVTFKVTGDFLFITLPSGRKMAYYKPSIDADGTLTYMGKDAYTTRWMRLQIYGGKIVENLTQAIARDVFFHGLGLYSDNGGQVVLRVHDELVATAKAELAKEELELMIHYMTTVPDWAEGLPLNAAGFITKRYMKD